MDEDVKLTLDDNIAAVYDGGDCNEPEDCCDSSEPDDGQSFWKWTPEKEANYQRMTECWATVQPLYESMRPSLDEYDTLFMTTPSLKKDSVFYFESFKQKSDHSLLSKRFQLKQYLGWTEDEIEAILGEERRFSHVNRMYDEMLAMEITKTAREFTGIVAEDADYLHYGLTQTVAKRPEHRTVKPLHELLNEMVSAITELQTDWAYLPQIGVPLNWEALQEAFPTVRELKMTAVMPQHAPMSVMKGATDGIMPPSDYHWNGTHPKHREACFDGLTREDHAEMERQRDAWYADPVNSAAMMDEMAEDERRAKRALNTNLCKEIVLTVDDTTMDCGVKPMEPVSRHKLMMCTPDYTSVKSIVPETQASVDRGNRVLTSRDVYRQIEDSMFAEVKGWCRTKGRKSLSSR